jgi:hypothetical protein
VASAGDVLVPVAEDVWTVAGEPILYPGIAFPTQMVVVRLQDGGLWLNSPVERTPAIAAAVDALGPVRALVCPNSFHHLFAGPWQAAFPEAELHAAPGLAKKRDDLRIDSELVDEVPALWREVLDQRCFRGNRLMEEFVFLHRPSRTLMITDLLVNLAVEDSPAPVRWFASFDRIRAPKGGTPRLFAWTQRSRAAARDCVEWMVASAPERILFPHGVPFEGDPVTVLREKFAWVTRP